MQWIIPAGRNAAIAALIWFSVFVTACGAGEEPRPAHAAASSSPGQTGSAVPSLSARASLQTANVPHAASSDTVHAVVHHSPTCGCCGKWVDHARANGIEVEARLTDDIQAVKRAHAIPASVQSCHTTIIGGYIVEGHVPADVIRQLLRERPAVRGIAAPGMPMGSPGMEGPYSEPYEIVTFDERGPTGVFARR